MSNNAHQTTIFDLISGEARQIELNAADEENRVPQYMGEIIANFDEEAFLREPDEEGQTVSAGAPAGPLNLAPPADVQLPNGDVLKVGWAMAAATPGVDPTASLWRSGAYVLDAEFKDLLKPEAWKKAPNVH
jgi:hypothetical protein